MPQKQPIENNPAGRKQLKEAVKQIRSLLGQIKVLNEDIKGIIKDLEQRGVDPAALKLGMRLSALGRDDVDLFDKSLAVTRDSLGEAP